MNEASEATGYDIAVRRARTQGAGMSGGDAATNPHDTTRADAGQLRLEIVTGTHRGAVLMLDRGDYRIGSSPDADIVLSDPGVVSEHAALHIDADGVRLDAIGADITVGNDPLPQSRGCRVRLPTSFSIGPAQIDLTDPSKGRARGPLRSPAVVAAGIACVTVIVAFTAVATREISSRRSARLAATAPAVAHPAVAPGPAATDFRTVASGPAAAPPPPTMAEATMALQAQLDAANIKSLEIAPEDGRLIVRGTLAGREATAWQPIEQWFDKSYGRSIPLTARISPGTKPNLPALQIQAVWYGERPYVLLANGEHYFKGAAVDNGWVISDILPDRLVLTKGGDTVSLTYH